MAKLCLFHTVDWIPNAFEAECVVFYWDTGRKGDRRYVKTRCEVFDATHVIGSIYKFMYGECKRHFLTGAWHVSEIEGDQLVRVRAYTKDYSTLLNEFTKPGVMLPA